MSLFNLWQDGNLWVIFRSEYDFRCADVHVLILGAWWTV